jgi:hypothetical protein
MTKPENQAEALDEKAIRLAAIEDVLGLLTGHELYRYRPQADAMMERACEAFTSTWADEEPFAKAHYRKNMRAALSAALASQPAVEGEAVACPCTCHPDDNPPRPCPQKYALSECWAAASGEVKRGNFVAVTTDEPQINNWHTAIYEDDDKGLLIAMCNQNGRYPWQVNAILAGLNSKREAMEAFVRPAAADAGVRTINSVSGTQPRSSLLSDPERVLATSPDVREAEESTSTNSRLEMAIALAVDRGSAGELTVADFEIAASNSLLAKAWHDAGIALAALSLAAKPGQAR